MIERYTLPEMSALWAEQNKFRKCVAWRSPSAGPTEMGTIPRDALEQIKARAVYIPASTRSKTTNHDVIAFTTNLAESIGEASRFVHYGLTSSDVVDTANALLLRDAADILLKKATTADLGSVARSSLRVRHRLDVRTAFTLNLRHSV